MAITRQLSNGNRLTDWTQEINDLPNEYGLMNASGLFSGQGTSQLSIVFDKNTKDLTLIPQTTRGGEATYGEERRVETFALALPYFKHMDRITGKDLQGFRMAGSPDSPETLANLRANKMMDMRARADQTREFMKIEAVKGITIDPEGNVLADMFAEFGLTRTDYQVDFLLGTAATNVQEKIRELKRGVARNAKFGGAIGRIEVPCSNEFFDALVKHPSIVSAYEQYANSGKQLLRDDLSSYFDWGVSDMFEFGGVLFYTYEAEFTKPDGTVVSAFDNDGYTIVRGQRDLYRGYFGPSDTLTGANSVGSEIMLGEFTDPRDKYIEMEMEMAPLYWMTKPAVSWRVFTSN